MRCFYCILLAYDINYFIIEIIFIYWINTILNEALIGCICQNLYVRNDENVLDDAYLAILKKIDYERISMPDKAGYDILIDMREYG